MKNSSNYNVEYRDGIKSEGDKIGMPCTHSTVSNPTKALSLMITSTAGSSQTLSRQPMDDNSPSRGIIVLSAGLIGVVVAAAVIVISVTVCLRKRNNKHITMLHMVRVGELSACDDVANQPSSGQL